MLPFVLRDGFDYCERTVKGVNQGLASIETDGTLSADTVATKARDVVARHARKAA
jgi:hypothetical protein